MSSKSYRCRYDSRRFVNGKSRYLVDAMIYLLSGYNGRGVQYCQDALSVPCRAHEHGTGLDACNRSLCRLDLRSDPGDDLQDPSRRVYMGEKMTLDHVLLVWFTKRSGRLSRILQMIPR